MGSLGDLNKEEVKLLRKVGQTSQQISHKLSLNKEMTHLSKKKQIALIKQKALAKHPDITVQAYEKILTRLHYCLYDEIQEVLNQLYKQLNSKIEMTSDDKLFAIALAVQSLERIHPFSDVNCRTFCMVFLNSLLIQNNFLPALIDDPNKFTTT